MAEPQCLGLARCSLRQVADQVSFKKTIEREVLFPSAINSTGQWSIFVSGVATEEGGCNFAN
jgi:hypothetical protein